MYTYICIIQYDNVVIVFSYMLLFVGFTKELKKLNVCI